MSIEVTGLYTHPIKSCGGIELAEATLTEYGVEYDREWMLIGSNNQMLTQRTVPQLALVKTELTPDKLTVSAPDIGHIAVSKNAQEYAGNPVIPIDVFNKAGSGTDQGKEAEDFFSELIGKPTRLVRIAERRSIKSQYQQEGYSRQIGFADGSPILLTSLASLAALNAHLEPKIDMNRFRPNIVIDGPELEPYAEDQMRLLKIGDTLLRIYTPSPRCPIPNIDQSTGILPKPKDRVVTEMLRQTHYGRDRVRGDGKLSDFFGQNVSHQIIPGAKISQEDNVEVIETATESNVELVTYSPRS